MWHLHTIQNAVLVQRLLFYNQDFSVLGILRKASALTTASLKPHHRRTHYCGNRASTMCEQTCPSRAGPEPMLQAGNLHWGQEKSVKFQPPVHILLVEIPEIYAMHACRWIGGWTGAFLINAMIAAYFLTFGVGFGIWAALKNLVDNINKYSVFANCYQVRLCTYLPPFLSTMSLWSQPCLQDFAESTRSMYDLQCLLV